MNQTTNQIIRLHSVCILIRPLLGNKYSLVQIIFLIINFKKLKRLIVLNTNMTVIFYFILQAGDADTLKYPLTYTYADTHTYAYRQTHIIIHSVLLTDKKRITDRQKSFFWKQVFTRFATTRKAKINILSSLLLG